MCEAVEDAEGKGAPAKDLRRKALESVSLPLSSFTVDAREAGKRSCAESAYVHAGRGHCGICKRPEKKTTLSMARRRKLEDGERREMGCAGGGTGQRRGVREVLGTFRYCPEDFRRKGLEPMAALNPRERRVPPPNTTTARQHHIQQNLAETLRLRFCRSGAHEYVEPAVAKR